MRYRQISSEVTTPHPQLRDGKNPKNPRTILGFLGFLGLNRKNPGVFWVFWGFLRFFGGFLVFLRVVGKVIVGKKNVGRVSCLEDLRVGKVEESESEVVFSNLDTFLVF